MLVSHISQPEVMAIRVGEGSRRILAMTSMTTTTATERQIRYWKASALASATWTAPRLQMTPDITATIVAVTGDRARGTARRYVVVN